MLIIVLLFSYIFISFLHPLADPDTPWHLKTGQYIYTHKIIPATDPFSFANDKIPFYGKFILSQNWLSQVFLFVIFKSAGPLGVTVTGAAIFTLLLLLLWLLIRKSGFYISLFVISGFGLNALNIYSGIRPQIFTFFFAGLVIFLLEKYKERRSTTYLYPLPFIMILWANIHGGFIYGILLMTIYVLSDGAALYFRRKQYPVDQGQIISNHFHNLLIAYSIAVIVSLINPNFYKTVLYIFVTQSSDIYRNIDEYRSPLSFITAKIHPATVYSFWAYLVVAVVLMVIFIKERAWHPMLLVVFAIIPAFFSIRYVPLFAIVTVATFRYVPFSGQNRLSAKAVTVLNFSILILIGVLIISANPFKNKELSQISESYCYPVQATEFLLKNRITGNIFSSYNKSGFLLFRLSPESKLYSDARFINVERIKKSFFIIGEADSMQERLEDINKLIPRNIGTIRITSLKKQKPKTDDNPVFMQNWEALLNEIQAEIIVHEAVNLYSGDVYPFIFKLMRADSWKLIYLDGNVMIFVKNIPKYKGIIALYGKSKTQINDEIIQECRLWFDNDTSQYYSNIALACLLKGMADHNVHNFIEKAIQLDRNNIIAQYSDALYHLLINKKILSLK